jgi:hypothetical protein
MSVQPNNDICVPFYVYLVYGYPIAELYNCVIFVVVLLSLLKLQEFKEILCMEHSQFIFCCVFN